MTATRKPLTRLGPALIPLLLAAVGARAQPSPAGIATLADYGAPDGYYVFYPSDYAPADTLQLAVFLHGYGGLNPLSYGAWLRTLVEAGSVVVYPRYQRNLFLTPSRRFVRHTRAGIRASLARIAAAGLPVDTSRALYIGHSYGGTIAAHLMARSVAYGLPRPVGGLLAAPGTSKLRGARLDSYAEIPPEVPLILVTHRGDRVVGSELARLIHASAPPSGSRVLLEQRACAPADGPRIGDGHNECYAIDEGFDSRYRNYTTRRARRIASVDAVDTLLYWPLTRALVAYGRTGTPPPLLRERPRYLSLGVPGLDSATAPVLARYADPAATSPPDSLSTASSR